ncbi:hypothetical protein F7D01_06250 [Erythrobacter sp. 3-20A1M]|nr:hypothetical protein F7D01_06250 [Erythrobacter sp. 3-20A1M]
MRPESIRKFDMLYLASIVVAIVNFFLGYGEMTAQAEAQMAANGLDMANAGTFLIGSFVVGMAISIGLWALISRLRIELVKWILILFFLWGLVSLPTMLQGDFSLMMVLTIVTYILQGVAIYFLFRPDAKAWFAEKRGS